MSNFIDENILKIARLLEIIKKYFTLLFILITSCSNTESVNSTPFEGNVLLKNQQEVNEFGSNNYSIINGNLVIGFQHDLRDIDDLSALSSLTNVKGNLDIKYNNFLKTLNGLNNLNSIDGELLIGDNGRLENLNGLNSLNLVKGIQIAFN